MVKCELCNTLTLQFNNHIKRRHPGCGQSAARKGYDSTGAYVDVWFKGECGSNFPFYLLCSSCREKYLAANLNDPSSKYERYNKYVHKMMCTGNMHACSTEHITNWLAVSFSHTFIKVKVGKCICSFSLLFIISVCSFLFRIKGLTCDLIGQLDSTSDGREHHFRTKIGYNKVNWCSWNGFF